jgi:hypothetical protein
MLKKILKLLSLASAQNVKSSVFISLHLYTNEFIIHNAMLKVLKFSIFRNKKEYTVIKLATLPEHLSSSHPGLSDVRVTRFLLLYVCFEDHCLSFCPFSFGHCIVCSPIQGF